MIASGSADFTVMIWNLESRECVKTLYGHTMPVQKNKICYVKFLFFYFKIWCIVALDEDILATAGEDCTLKLWEWETEECFKTLVAHGSPIWGLAKDKYGNVATASWDKTVIIWSMMDGRKELKKKK